jgi:prepilin-type N-terminal cleavage/methylation domain-containing protein
MAKRSQRAFTLVELLVTIAIIIFVAGMIVPMVSAFTTGGITEQSVNVVKSYLMLARQQAVQHGKPVAVFFLPPTQLTTYSRMIMVEARKDFGTSTDITSITNWRVIPGEHGAALRRPIEVRKVGDNSKIPKAFCIVFTAGGYVDSRCPPANTSLRVGPSPHSDSGLTSIDVPINRNTGGVLKLKRNQ